MAMTRKQQRSAFVLTGLVILGLAAALVLTALQSSQEGNLYIARVKARQTANGYLQCAL